MLMLAHSMARILLCLILSLAVHATAHSQSSTPPLYQQVDSILGDLDFSDVTSQVLYNKGFDMWNWAYYDGAMPSDSAAHSAGQWGWMQVQAVTSFLGSYDPLPNPEIYIDLMQDLSDDDPIPIATLWLDYHSLREDAVSEGLIYIDPVDSTLHDVFPRPESPYLRDTTFMGTALLHQIRVGSRQLVFMDTLLMDNIGLSYTISINLNDGVGWRSVTPGTPINVTFDSVGTQYLTIRFTDNNSREWHAKTQIEIIEDPEQQGGGSFRGSEYSDVPDETITDISGVQLDIFFGNDCDKLLKPFIFIEGFNPSTLQNQRWDEMIRRLNNPEYDGNEILTPTENTTWQDLYNSGYDVIYVDFADGAADIFDNGGVVREVIEWVNAEKAANGSAEKNTVLGASMGGLCGYWALGKMEADNVDHEVEKFITFDTPFRGANIPIGLQLMVKHLYEYKIGGGKWLRDEVPFLTLAKSVFDLPAAKQMMYFNAWEGTKNGFSTWRNDFYNQLFTVSVNNAEHIAISNGSGIGMSQLMTCGGLYLDVPEQSDGNFWGTFKIKKAKVYLAQNFNSNQTLYEYSFYKRLYVFLGFVWEWGSYGDYSIPSIDCAPGGVSDFGVGFLVSDAVGNGASIGEIFPQPNLAAFCFVPTISSQNIADQSNFFLTFPAGSCTNSSLEVCIQSRDNDYTSPYAGIPAHNQNHVVLTSNLATFLLNGFYSPEIPGIISDFSFNLGKSIPSTQVDPEILSFTSTGSVINKSIGIFNTGKLLINRADRLARTDILANPSNGSGQHIDISVTKDCEENPSIITVSNNGEVSIGEDEGLLGLNTANLIFEDESELVVGAEGNFYLNKDSKIIFKENTKATISDGGFLDAKWGSQVVLEEGSEMIVESGATLRISHYSSLIIEQGAVLTIEDGAIIQLWDGSNPGGDARIVVKGTLAVGESLSISGNGFFDMYSTHTLNFASNKFSLKGEGINHRLLRLNDLTYLDISNITFNLDDALVEFMSGSSINLENSAKAFFTYVTFETQAQATSAIQGYEYQAFESKNCVFANFYQGIMLEAPIPTHYTHTRITNCDFKSNRSSIILVEMDQAYITNSHIDGYNIGQSNGIEFQNIDQLSITASTITRTEYGIRSYTGNEITRVVIHNSTLNANVYGVYNDDVQSKVNIVAQDRTVFEDNTTAIYIEQGGLDNNGLDYGLVKLDCISLINNDVGVEGKDLLLMIDAYNNSKQTGPGYALRSNTFRCGTGQVIFDLCYEYRLVNSTNKILARGNFWDHIPTTPYIIRTTGYHCSSSNAIQSEGNINRTLAVTSEPETCGALVADPDFEEHIDTKCKIYDENQTMILDLRALYKDFESDWRSETSNEKYDLNDDWYNMATTIAQYDPFDTTLSHVCHLYIQEVRTFSHTSTSSYGLPDAYVQQPTLNSFKGDLDIFPIPFDNELYVKLQEDDNSIITVLDMLGKIVHTSRSEGLAIIDTHSWRPGVYILRITDGKGQVNSSPIIKQGN